MKNRSSIFMLLISLLLAAGILGYIFSSVSLAEILSAIGNAKREAVAAFLVASLSTSFFRAWRYRLLLRSNGYETPFPSMYLIVLIRNTFSDLLPARLGTLMYVFLATTRLGIPLGAAGASFALAFLFDMIAIVPLIIACLVLAGGGHGFSVTGLSILSLILLAISAGLVLILPKLLKFISSLLQQRRIIPSRMKGRVLDTLSKVASGIEETRSAGIYGRVLILSILVRFGKYVGLYLFLFALLEPLGYSIDDMSFPLVFLGLCAAELAASLPISGIAGVGAYQGAWVAAFSLLGFPLELAKLTSVGHHLFTQAYGYGLGAAAFLLVLLPFFKREPPAAGSAKLAMASVSAFSLQLVLSIAVVSTAIVQILSSSLP